MLYKHLVQTCQQSDVAQKQQNVWQLSRVQNENMNKNSDTIAERLQPKTG